MAVTQIGVSAWKIEKGDLTDRQVQQIGEKTKAWAEQLLDRSRKMFSAWHRHDEMTEVGFHRSMITHRDRFLEIVRTPPDSKEAANLTDRFREVALEDDSEYDMSQDYFRFLFESGVESTNNYSEQQIRYCVIDRRITQGTRSNAGQRYHERMWTAIATCGKQGRSFSHFLHQSISANVNGKRHPLSCQISHKAVNGYRVSLLASLAHDIHFNNPINSSVAMQIKTICQPHPGPS